MCENHLPCDHCDVVVVGGGPAGSTAATLLSERGWRVVLLEKARHPRFHIGESLLPLNLPIFERLGVADAVGALGVVKRGADFTCDQHGDRHESVYFSDAIDPANGHAFQVRRDELDHLLLRNSVAKGVDVREGMRVTGVVLDGANGSQVTAIDEGGREQCWQTRFLVDASGRDTFLAAKLGGKRKNPRHQSAAVFGHFRGIQRRTGRDEGNISIYWFEHGWFWMIPLRDGVTSVGAVCWPQYLKTRRADLETFLWQTMRLCPGVYERAHSASVVGEVRAAGNYSYRAQRMYDSGYVLLGDAYAFVDPVFSSGVYLAMNSASLGVPAIDAALRGAPSAERQFRRFERDVRRGIGAFSWFIFRFTSPAIRELFMAPSDAFRIKAAVISVLAGDVLRNRRLALPLALFKAVYYATAARHAVRAWQAYRHRRNNAGIVLRSDAPDLQ